MKIKIAFLFLSLTALAILVLPKPLLAQGTAVFLSGNLMTAGNRSTPTVDWGDPIDAKPGEVIEFRVVAQNTAPGTTANNVKVVGNLPSTPATSLVASGTISADNAASVTDTVTINVTGGEQQSFAFIEGHTRVFSASCPSGCDIAGNTVVTSGVNVGNLPFGESAQVLFKAFVTNVAPSATPTPTVPAATATPTPTPTVPAATATPTVTPTPQPQGGQQGVLQCPAGFIQTVSGSNILCIQVQQQQTATGGSASASTGPINVSVAGAAAGGAAPTATPTPKPTGVPPVTQLPKTGLPPLSWALGGLLPIGWRLRKFAFKSKDDSEETAQSAWQKREFEKEI